MSDGLDGKATSSTNNNSVACKEKKEDNCKGKMFKFTINNYDDDVIKKLHKFIFNSTYHKIVYSIGFEIGEEGTPHIQGYLRFQNDIRRSTIKLHLEKEFFCELVKKGRKQEYIDVDRQCDTYCQKDKDPRNYTNVKQKKTFKCISKEQLRPFQKDLLLMAQDEKLNGMITWVYDDVGQTGKTAFLRHYVLNYDGMFTYGGKCADVINLVFNNKEKIMENDNNCLIFNLGRDTDPRKVSYRSMEQVCDGCICNTKFEAGSFICDPINIIVLANCLPKFEGITKSRWIIKIVNANYELEDYKEKPNLLDDSDSDISI